MSSFLSRPSSPLNHLSLSRGDLQFYAVRGLILFFSIYIFSHLTSPHPRTPTWPLAVDALNNATLGFEHIVHLTSKEKYKDDSSVFFSLPVYKGGILKSSDRANPSVIEATTLKVEANAPKRKGYTAVITRILERGYTTTLVIEEKLGINARARAELYSIHRALHARPQYEDMQMSTLHKLKGYWDEPDAMIPRGPQPVYQPYYRAPPSRDVGIDDYAFEKLVTGPELGATKEHTHKSNLKIGEWDLIFLASCRAKFDEEAQKKLRSSQQERTPWRPIDWVSSPESTTELWYAEKSDPERAYERKIHQKKRDQGLAGEKDILGQGLRRVEGFDDACILAFVVSRRGALKLQKHFGASDPGLGTQDLLARFCGDGRENVCFVLGEGVVRGEKGG